MKPTSAASSRVALTSGPANGQPLPQEAVIVGIDGGYVRNWHDKKHNFEVIVGKSMAADRDDRYFGLVRSQDEQPERRLPRGSAHSGPAGDPAGHDADRRRRQRARAGGRTLARRRASSSTGSTSPCG